MLILESAQEVFHYKQNYKLKLNFDLRVKILDKVNYVNIEIKDNQKRLKI